MGSPEALLRAGGGALCAKGRGVAAKERNCAQTRGEGWLPADLLPGGSERKPRRDVTPETVKRPCSVLGSSPASGANANPFLTDLVLLIDLSIPSSNI